MNTHISILIRIIPLITFLLVGTASVYSQIMFSDTVIDGSFERELQNPPDNRFPIVEWRDCNTSQNSPYAQPGYWGVNLQPYHGKQYLGLVNKGFSESVSQALDLKNGKEYFVVMYLASTDDYGPNGRNPEGSLSLIWGSQQQVAWNIPCPKLVDTIWQSPVIDRERWSFHVANFEAEGKGWLTFKVGVTENYPIQTNILIDSVAGPFPGKWPFPELGEDQSLCQGDTLEVELRPLPNADFQYQWNDGNSERVRFFTQSGTYSVCSTWRGLRQCDEITITFESLPQIELGADTLMCLGDTLFLDVGIKRPNYEYTWQDNTLDSLYAVTQSTSLIVEASNSICTVSGERTVLFRDCQAVLEMPNVFTPNGDGINDEFRPMKAVVNIQSIQIDIYDRWGRPVTSLRGLDQGWDGRNANGVYLVEGVYFWVVRFLAFGGSDMEFLNGNVTLTR